MKEKLYNNVICNFQDICERVACAAQQVGRAPNEIQIMAVTKNVPPDNVNIAIEHGVTLLGENRVQEFLDKLSYYHNNGIDIHFIGHLQTNKVKYIIDKVSMIHSVDRINLAQEIEKQAALHNKIMDVLIEVNIGKEDTKYGVFPEFLDDFYDEIKRFAHIRVRGLMAIPPSCNNAEDSVPYFQKMQQLLVDIINKNEDNRSIDILSMGMSQDFETAIHFGANIIRIGTGLFGERG